MEKLEKASLRTLDQGHAIEAFDFELQKAIENALDPNTEAKAVRKVKLEVKIIPTPERTQASVVYQAASNLAPDSPQATHFYISQTKDGPVAVEYNPQQMTFDDFVKEENAGKAAIVNLEK